MDQVARDRRVSLVLITYNRVAEILRTLGRLSALPESPAIVVVDNGSSDGTREAVSRQFPGVEVIDAGGNLGAAARTIGVRHVKTPYVAFCDDDIWWEPGSLRRAADLLDSTPRLALLGARVVVEPGGALDPLCAVLERSPLHRPSDLPGPLILGFLAGASVVRCSAYLKAGGFEPRFFIGGEEQLLAADLAARGGWLCYAPDLVAHHQPSPSRDNFRRRCVMTRNELWFQWLRRPAGRALRSTMALVCRRPWDGATAWGLLTAAWGLGWVLRHRQVVPPEIERCLQLIESSD